MCLLPGKRSASGLVPESARQTCLCSSFNAFCPATSQDSRCRERGLAHWPSSTENFRVGLIWEGGKSDHPEDGGPAFPKDTLERKWWGPLATTEEKLPPPPRSHRLMAEGGFQLESFRIRK